MYHSQLQPWKPIVKMLRAGSQQHVFLFIEQFTIDFNLFLFNFILYPWFPMRGETPSEFHDEYQNSIRKQQNYQISRNSVRGWMTVVRVSNIVVPGTIEKMFYKLDPDKWLSISRSTVSLNIANLNFEGTVFKWRVKFQFNVVYKRQDYTSLFSFEGFPRSCRGKNPLITNI